jgi:hypothetical protein
VNEQHVGCENVQSLLAAEAVPGRRVEFGEFGERVVDHLHGCLKCREFLAALVVLTPELQAMLRSNDPGIVDADFASAAPRKFNRLSMLRKSRLAAAACVSVVAVLCVWLWPPSLPAELPRHAILAERAGKALDDGQYNEVIALSQECIDGFAAPAMRLQEKLEQSGVKLPTGVVDSKVREKLLLHGPLNDVAACYFYLGQAQRKLGRIDEARSAYAKAATLTCARVWDPRSENPFFWEPAQDAAWWLNELSKKSETADR